MDKVTFRRLVLARKFALKAIEEVCRSDYDPHDAIRWNGHLGLVCQEILQALEEQLDKEE